MAMRGRALTEEMVFMRTKCNRMDLIKNLNLWGNNLQDISVLAGMPNLEVLSLSVNQVTSLVDLQHCPKLAELYLRKNEIGDLAEILYLKGLRHMRVLWLADNPCSNLPHYRQYVLHHLPNLVKIDAHDVTDEERRQARDADFGRTQTRPDEDMDSEPGEDEKAENAWEQHERSMEMQQGADLRTLRRPNTFPSEHPDRGGDLRLPRRGNSFEADVSERSMDRGVDPRALRHGSFDAETAASDPRLPRRGNSFDGELPDRSPGWGQDEEPLRPPPASLGGERALPRRPCGRYPDFAEEYPSSPTAASAALGRQSYGGSGGCGGGNPDWAAEKPPQYRHSDGGGTGNASPCGPGGGPRHAWASGGRQPLPVYAREEQQQRAAWPGATRGSHDAWASRSIDVRPGDPRRVSAPELEMQHSRFAPRDLCDPRDPRDPRGDPQRWHEPELEPRAGRADNILCAVLALIKELDAQGLELVRRAVEQRCSEL